MSFRDAAVAMKNDTVDPMHLSIPHIFVWTGNYIELPSGHFYAPIPEYRLQDSYRMSETVYSCSECGGDPNTKVQNLRRIISPQLAAL